MPGENSFARKVAAALITALGVCLVAGIYSLSIDTKSVTARDFIEYWAAEKQLADGANPYDVNAIFRMEKSLGMEGNDPKITLSPPVAFFFALPLAWLPAKPALIFSMLLQLAAAGICAWLLWILYGRRDTRLHLLVFAFPPTIASLMAGQLGVLFLLAFVLFLYFFKSRPWLAGAALLPCALKPHLFLACIVVLLLWSARRRDFRVIAGFVIALAASSALTLSLDHNIWQQYRQLMQSARIMDVFLPTVGVALRFLIDRQAKWIEFVPTALGCAWSAWFYFAHRDRWDWMNEGMLVLLVSVACSPYSWFSDQALLFPAVLAGMFAAESNRWDWILLGLIVAASAPGVVLGIQLPSPFYLWTAPAWLAWYLVATRRKSGAGVANAAMTAMAE